MVPELRRAIGAEGRALLKVQPARSPGGADGDLRGDRIRCGLRGKLTEARLGLLQQRGYEGMEQWKQLLEELGRSEEEVLERLRQGIQRRSFMRERFAAKAEARFLERKNELDQVVYSLLRLENSFLARELYLQIDSGESNFADLAKRYAEGPERNTNGIVGPVSLTQAHPVLVEKLRVAQPGFCLSPSEFRIGGSSSGWSATRRQPSRMRSPIRCARRCSTPGSTKKPKRT